jgi:hypothetical protein
MSYRFSSTIIQIDQSIILLNAHSFIKQSNHLQHYFVKASLFPKIFSEQSSLALARCNMYFINPNTTMKPHQMYYTSLVQWFNGTHSNRLRVRFIFSFNDYFFVNGQPGYSSKHDKRQVSKV